jgi:uncharacterized repeat protein (TIGR03803 family)
MLKPVGFVLILSVGLGACSHAAVPNFLPGVSGASPFMQSAAVRYKTLFNFDEANGADPVANLIDVKGTLYGTTSEAGGTGYNGTVFSISPAGHEHTLHSFLGTADGADPVAALIYANGTFYGTTNNGGKHNYGTVFSMSPSGRLRVLHSFAGPPNDGEGPQGSLVVLHGVLYGTTFNGGKIGFGTIFSITKTGKEHVIYSFPAAAYGEFPVAGLLVSHGVLYGTGGGGVYDGAGTVFSITTNGTEKVLHSFGGPNNDGSGAISALTQVGHLFYGTTSRGGAYGGGTVFSISPSGAEKVIHSFGSGKDGSTPQGGNGPLALHDGALYGTTEEGGANSQGTVFSVSTAGAERVLYSFGAFPAARLPHGGVTAVKDTLYGTSVTGGSGLYGTVFALTP